VRFRINSPKVIHQIFETEVVVVNLESGNYYSVGGSGIEIWRQLDAGRSREEIVARFSNDEEAQKVRSFLDEIEREELIAPDETRAADVAAVESTRNGAFAPPTLEKFDDMRDLLLLDPIHELDESGWPRNAPPLQA
jgi:hypothetical protein